MRRKSWTRLSNNSKPQFLGAGLSPSTREWLTPGCKMSGLLLVERCLLGVDRWKVIWQSAETSAQKSHRLLLLLAYLIFYVGTVVVPFLWGIVISFKVELNLTPTELGLVEKLSGCPQGPNALGDGQKLHLFHGCFYDADDHNFLGSRFIDQTGPEKIHGLFRHRISPVLCVFRRCLFDGL